MANEEKLDIVVRMKDFATAEFGRLRTGIHGFTSGAVNAFKGITGAVFSLKGALVGLGVALSVRELVGMVNATADAADNLRDLSLQTGVSVEALSELKFAAELSGASVEDLEVGFRKAQKNLSEFARTAGGEASDAASLLGADFKIAALQGASLESLLPLVSDGIKKLGASDRVLVASQLFGRGGAKLIPLLIDDMDKLRARARELGVTLSGPAADAADKYNDSLVELKGAFQGLKNSAILTILPELTKGLTNLATEIAQNRPVILEFLASISVGFGSFAKSTTETVISIEASIGGLLNVVTRAKIVSDALAGALGKAGAGVAEAVRQYRVFQGEDSKGAEALADELNKNSEKLLRGAGELSDELFNGTAQRAEKLRALGAAADGAGQSVAARLREVAKGIRDIGSDADFVGPKFKDAFEAMGPQLKDASIDVDELQKRIKAAADRDARLIEEAKERIEFLRKSVAGVATEWEHVHSATMGARDAFLELQEQSTQWGIATKDAILSVSHALASDTSNALLSVVDHTKSARAAFHELAQAILKDIARIIIETLILKAVEAAVGGLGGTIFGNTTFGTPSEGTSFKGSVAGSSFKAKADGGIVGGHLVPYRGAMAMGGVVRQDGFFRLRERGQNEAIVPLPDNRSIPVKLQGRGGQSIVVQQTLNFSFPRPAGGADSKEETRFIERNKRAIVAAVIEANNSSLQSRAGLA